jgi:cell division protein FtsL
MILKTLDQFERLITNAAGVDPNEVNYWRVKRIKERIQKYVYIVIGFTICGVAWSWHSYTQVQYINDLDHKIHQYEKRHNQYSSKLKDLGWVWRNKKFVKEGK